MKTIIKTSLLAGVLALGAVSCGENSWNNQLDGFNPNPDYTDVKSMDYTLTAADYKTLADNATNKALATGDTANALKSVGTLAYFNQMVSPDKYVPALLRDEKFSYFGLTEGSAINVTYRIAQNLPEKMIQMNAASEYTVTAEDYQKVYGSDENFAETFCPKFSAAANLPKILKTAYPEAVNGQYAVVGYNNSDLDPTFGEAPKFAETSVLGNLTVGAEVDAKGYVTGICSRGFILTDKGGSILVYVASGFVQADWKVGDQVSVKGAVSAYNNGFQIDGSVATIVKEGTGKYTYPAPVKYTGAQIDEAIQTPDNFGAKYCEFTGTLTVSGNYYNITLDGATVATGSVYQISDEMKAALVADTKYTFRGYFVSISKSGTPKVPKFFNVLLTSATPVAAGAPKRVVTRAGSQVPTTFTYAVYKYDGSKWAVAGDVAILQPADYAAMGSKSDLSGDKPETYIPLYMAKTFPYGAKDAVKYVMYKYYANKQSVLRCEEYTNNGTEWVNTITNGGIITETKQFVYKPQGWVMDPSVVLTLPAVKGDATSAKFYQACVDWVKNNVDGGAAYISSYGNNDYYTGASAYQCNVDLRASAARTQNPTAYPEQMSDDEVVALMKKRWENEVCPAVLGQWYPNMDVVPGLEVTATVNFSVYNGTTTPYTIVYKVVGKGKFEFVSCTWNQ